jgi:hypothetical protein
MLAGGQGPARERVRHGWVAVRYSVGHLLFQLSGREPDSVVRPVPLATAVFHSHIHASSLSPHLSCRPGASSLLSGGFIGCPWNRVSKQVFARHGTMAIEARLPSVWRPTLYSRRVRCDMPGVNSSTPLQPYRAARWVALPCAAGLSWRLSSHLHMGVAGAALGSC